MEPVILIYNKISPGIKEKVNSVKYVTLDHKTSQFFKTEIYTSSDS